MDASGGVAAGGLGDPIDEMVSITQILVRTPSRSL